MKKALIIGLIALILPCVLFAGGGKDKSGGPVEPPYSLDLSTLEFVKNTAPLTKDWEDFMIPLTFDRDVSSYTRITVRTKFYNAAGEEIQQADGQVMVSLVVDLDGDWRGPEMGPGPNTPLKEFNVGGFSSTLHGERGVRVRLSANPGGILFQRNPASPVAFIELTELILHNGSASGN